MSEIKDTDSVKVCNADDLSLCDNGILSDSHESDEDVLDVVHPVYPRIIDKNSLDACHPYEMVYQDVPHTELMPFVYIPNCDIKLLVKDIIELTSALHRVFNKKLAKVSLPGAKTYQRLRGSLNQYEDQIEGHSSATYSKKIIKFPRSAINKGEFDASQKLQQYLTSLLQHPLYRNHHAVLEFFEMSPFSFVGALGFKFREGFIKKLSGNYSSTTCGRMCNCLSNFKEKWLVLKENYMFFVNTKTGEKRSVMLMDSTFQVSHGFKQTGILKGLLISNLSRTILLKCDGDQSDEEWYESIEVARKNFGADFCLKNTFDSFVPLHTHINARWYVDGSCYMNDVAEILDSAQSEIFITDWWLSPDIYLKRPDWTGVQWKLIEVLLRQANRGIKIFILLYKEVELALGINSFYTKHILAKQHENIKVLRHPDHVKAGSLIWAHHEKLVIVDQNFAFVGGIDLCYGRWDDYRHKLIDLGHGGIKSKLPRGDNASLVQLAKTTSNFFLSHLSASEPNINFCTSDTSESYVSDSLEKNGIKDETAITSCIPQSNHNFDVPDSIYSCTNDIESSSIKNLSSSSEGAVIEYTKDNLSLCTCPVKMCDKCLGLQSKTRQKERLLHFNKKDKCVESSELDSVAQSSQTAFQTVKAISVDLLDEMREKKKEVKAFLSDKRISRFYWHRSQRKNKKINKLAEAVSLAQVHCQFSYEKDSSVHLWVGKDYVNWIAKDLSAPDEPFKDNIDRHTIPRMPWHDISLYVEGAAARDVARHFIQRWNAVKSEKFNRNVNYPYLIPKSYASDFAFSSLKPKYLVSCQVLRSIGMWSGGLSQDECSIYNAYVHAICNAKYYVYIENQFFITCSTEKEKRDIGNCIGRALVDRIYKAFQNNEVFRVYVILPLLPAFEGQIGTSSGIAMQYIVHYTYESIVRGKFSLLTALKARGIDNWEKYISFCSLRTHDFLEGNIVTELIYVHSKLLIVDDCIVIAGSANINDRSMLGSRDSEVDLYIEDEEFEFGIMNGIKVSCGVFAGSLRRFLFSEHLGLTNDPSADFKIADPASDTFFVDVWRRIAARNSQIYEDIFSCIPADSVQKFCDIKNRRSHMTILGTSANFERLSHIQGHLVSFPLKFLRNEAIKPGVGNKECLLPSELWI